MNKVSCLLYTILLLCINVLISHAQTLSLEWPVSGASGRDWVINNYVDLDPSNGLRDYRGGRKTYNNHNGIDIDIATFRGTDDNTARVLAAADGVVSAIFNNNPADRHIGSGCSGQWNAVYVEHASGLTLMYGHLKYNSVAVSVGRRVSTGDVLGIIGSSGCSSQPHLHFEIRDAQGAVVDPFEQGMWARPPAYNPPLTLMDYIIHEGDFPIDATHTLIDPMANITHLTPGNLLVVGFHLAGGDAGDTYHVILYDPNGDVFQSFSHTFSSSARHTWWYWLFEPSEEDRGTWSVDIELNGTVQVSHDFANGSLESSHVYQAEAADLLQGGAIESNHNGFNGLGFANMSPSNGRLRWSNIDAGSGGAVLVALRYALKASASRTAELIVNGATQTITFEPTGQWNRWNHVYQQVNLRDTLSNRIELHTTGQDSGNIDELVIAMQAEDAFVNGRGKIERNHAGFRGTGFVNLQPAGGVIEWADVDGRGGGAANLTFRYALGASAARTAQLHINGDTQTIRFEPTGSWSTWSTIRVRTWLGSGPANTVLMETQGEDAGNIDQLFVTN